MFRPPFSKGRKRGVSRGAGLSASRLQRAEANDFLRNGNTGAAGAKWRLPGPRVERGAALLAPKQDTY